MSEAHLAAPRGRFDDRVDTNTDIGTGAALMLLGRSFTLLGRVKRLFAGKALLSALALLPGLLLPWIAKIVVDQVILQQPFGGTEVRFPPYMTPIVDYLTGMSPMGIMASILGGYAVLLIIFGSRGGGTGFGLLMGGQDAATQSEQQLSAGSSKSSGVLGVVETLIDVRLSQRISNILRTRLFQRLTHLPMTTLDDHRIGDSVYRVMYDAPQVPEICFNLSLTPIFTLIGAALTLYFMQYSYGEVAPEVVWVAVAMVPFTLLVTFPLSGIIRRVNQASRASGAATTNTMEESIDNISAVQSLGGMQREVGRFEEKSAESFRRHRHVIFFGYAGAAFSIFGSAVGGVYVTVLITDLIIAGQMTVGDYAVLLGLFLSLGGTAMAIGMYWIGLQSNVAAVRRVFFFIDYDTEDRAATKPDLQPLQHNVILEHVDFRYPDGRQALKNVNLTFNVGELVAIVGSTGAGKTSLAYLLPGFLHPTTGRVLFDGLDIAEVNLDSLRNQVSYVFQEHTLLSESIRRNFQLVKPDATEAEMLTACEAAGAMEFIRAMPDGLDTVLGRSGNTLSVGQQQRLSIARGLLRNTPVLILDEPTAALDPQAENALVRSMQEAARGRLVIVIAHRLSTIRQADRIIFLQDGQVLDEGNHATLMQNPQGPYRRFVDLQGG